MAVKVRISTEDLSKFAEIFVDIYEYGSKVAYNNSYADLVENNVDDEILERWKAFLSYTCEDFEDDLDAYDDWYYNLHNIDDIDPRKLARFDLPSNTIEIRLGNEESFMRKLFSLANDFIENNKSHCTEDTKVGSAIQFTSQAVYVTVYTYSKQADKKHLSAAKTNFLNFFNAAKALGDQFNELQGKTQPHIGIGSSINDHYLLGDPLYERTFAIDDGCDTLYYSKKGKVKVSQEYADMFYSIIPETTIIIGPKMAE